MSKLIEARAEFRELATVRLNEANVLLDAEMWDGAYYLAGYAVELGLKACIINKVMATDKFQDRKFSESCYTHKFKDLLALAGLKSLCKAMEDADPDFLKNWKFTVLWSEQKRYHRISKRDADKLYKSIADTTHGVFQWIQIYW